MLALVPFEATDFSVRSSQAEVMDEPTVAPSDYARCLSELATVNALTFTHAPTLAWLTRQLARVEKRPLVILDVAFGQGDLLRAIWSWAQERGVEVELHGVDLNPRSAAMARAATPSEMNITFHTGDVFQHQPARRPDFIVSSQFTHHLGDEELARFVTWLDATAAEAWLVVDLERSKPATWGFRALCTVAGFHPIVKRDGLVSIARSLRPAEWSSLLERAGVDAQVSRRFPFRLCIESTSQARS
jgi:trans-aconitate methyltransferase